MSAPRGTTPTLMLTFKEANLDLTEAANVYVTFQFGPTQLTKTGEDLANCVDIYNDPTNL